MVRAGHLHRESVLQVLRMVGDVDWARLAIGDGSNPAAPLVVWRYRDEPEWAAAILTSAVNTYRGQVPWVIEKPGRNWVLWPEREKHDFARGEWRTDSDYFAELTKRDPAFCSRALEDLADLLEHVARELELPNTSD